MSELKRLFASLAQKNRKALMPFITAGDPGISTTAAVIQAAQKAGADLCEVGVPYSDPVADGPVIQASYQRALGAGFRLENLFELGRNLSDQPAGSMPRVTMPRVTMPRVTMVSYSIIYRIGMAKYITQAKQAGYSGAIVPDLLVEEAAPLSQICRDAEFDLIQLITPTTPRDRQRRIADLTTGFLYYVSVTGITGERTALPDNLIDNVSWLREQTELPVCIGFGISGPETAAQLAPIADGLIVGSAIVRRIAEASRSAEQAGYDPAPAAAEVVGKFCGELRRAIDEAVVQASA